MTRQQEYAKEYYQRNHEKLVAYSRWYRANFKDKAEVATRNWRHANPEKCKAINKRAHASKRANPERWAVEQQHGRKSNYLYRRTGITLEEFDAIVATQGSRCTICGDYEKLHADHNHKTNTFRGAICGRCNRGIGMFRDNTGFLANAIEYLDGTLKI